MAAWNLPLEIVGMIIDNVETVLDLLNCTCVNSTWNVVASRKLYRGCQNDLQFRTPEIEALICLYVASRERFTRNMSFVRHLLLCPETPTVDISAYPNTRLAAFENGGSVRRTRFAELLVKSVGGRLESLAIPFEFMGRPWSVISDLLFSPSIEFLAIDGQYCEVLLTSPIYSAGKFSNLKALTIYKSDCRQKTEKLCRVIDACDLQFLHLEHLCAEDCLSMQDGVDLFQCLQRQDNIKALALVIPEESFSTDLTYGLISDSDKQWIGLWPELRFLELKFANQYILRQLPNFKELRILTLHSLDTETPFIGEIALVNIAKCRNLRAVELIVPDLADWDMLVVVAHGCPLLRKMSVWLSETEKTLPEYVFKGILHALPHLEALELNANFEMDAVSLAMLARSCPRLRIVDMPDSILRLSVEHLAFFRPFRQLESLSFQTIIFENAHRFMEQRLIARIAEEWRRVFPKLRAVPCPRDMHLPPIAEKNLADDNDDDEEEEEEEKMSVCENDPSNEEKSDEETGSEEEDEKPLPSPSLAENDFESDCFKLRIKLWRALEYKQDEMLLVQVQAMWRTSLQIDTVGWSVIPLDAFTGPNSCSPKWDDPIPAEFQ